MTFSTSVVFSVTKLTSAAPDAPSVQANLYLATSEDRHASKTAPGGESSWCRACHFSCFVAAVTHEALLLSYSALTWGVLVAVARI